MEPNEDEESDKQGKYMPEVGMPSFSVQGLSDALTALETVTEVQPPSEEFALQLKVMMADHPGQVLKSDPTLRDLEHIQVDGPGMAYLLFFDKQVHQGLTLEAAQAMRAHITEAFAEWISCSVHFAVNPIPLAEGWRYAMAASEQCRLQSQAEYPGQPVPNMASSESDSTPPLVGSAPFCHEVWSSGGHWE